MASPISYAEDLSSILNLALDVDPTLQQAKANNLVAFELLPQARAVMLPTVQATGNTAYNNSNNPSTGSFNTFSYGITLTHPVFNYSNWQQYKQVDAKVKSAAATLEDAKQDLYLRVATQYFAILKAMDDYNFSVAERKAFARHLEETEQKFNAGVIAITDVNEAQAKYDGAIAQEITSENEVHNQQELMGNITGVAAGNISILKPNINLQRPVPDDMEYWVKTAVKQSFAIQAKEFDAESAKRNIEQQKSGHMPTVDLSLSSTKGKTTPPVPPQSIVARTNTVSLTLTVPIYSSGKVNSKIRQAAYQYQVAIQQANDSRLQTISNIRQAYRGILTQISQIKALQQSVISSKSALDATEAAFDAGTRTIVDVLNAQSDLLNAKSNLSKARYDYITASFRLKRYAGILSAADLNIINSWLQTTSSKPEKPAAATNASPATDDAKTTEPAATPAQTTTNVSPATDDTKTTEPAAMPTQTATTPETNS